jgi:L-fuculose-phosphate aldolase
MDVLRRDLVQHYRWLREGGYNDSHSGNASVRTREEIIITPTGAWAERLRVEELVHWSLDDEPPPRASMDARLHQAVYAALPDARAILHSHCPHLVALTLDGDPFVPQDFEGMHYFGPQVPVVEVDPAHYFEQSPAKTAEALRSAPAAVVRGHGVYVWGTHLEQAYQRTTAVELSARIAWLARSNPGRAPRGLRGG